MKNIKKGKFFGTVTVGERGQVVIPAEIRKALKINGGEKLIVMSKGDMLSFVRLDDFNQFIDRASELMSNIKKDNQ